MSDTNQNDGNKAAGADPFLAELQQEFLSDPEEHLKGMREALGSLSADPLAGIHKVHKICASIPALAEPVGFTHLANLMREFDVILKDLAAAYVALQGDYKDDDTRVLEFFLGDAIQNIESYYADLKADQKDHEGRADERRPSMRILSNWRPAAPEVAPTSAPAIEFVLESAPSSEVAAAPVAAEPVAVVAAPESAPAPVLAPTQAPVVAAAPAPVAKDNVVELRPKSDGSALDGEEPVREDSVLQHQYLICRASLKLETSKSEYRAFAIPVRQVLEVIDYQVVNPLPYPRPGISGMLNFRGDPLPIMICDDHGGDQAAARWKRKGYIVIARIADRTFGFQMEQVLSVTILNPSEFQLPEGILGMGKATWVTHLVRTENEVVMVMDLNRALAA